jgi:mannose-1-phosphate guanylyltransferase
MQVKIYQPAKTTTQSGKKDRSWILVPVLEQNSQSTNNLMGWTSSDNTLTQLKLKFKTVDEATQYAEQKGWNCQIIEPNAAQISKKSYADNFL